MPMSFHYKAQLKQMSNVNVIYPNIIEHTTQLPNYNGTYLFIQLKGPNTYSYKETVGQSLYSMYRGLDLLSCF